MALRNQLEALLGWVHIDKPLVVNAIHNNSLGVIVFREEPNQYVCRVLTCAPVRIKFIGCVDAPANLERFQFQTCKYWGTNPKDMYIMKLYLVPRYLQGDVLFTNSDCKLANPPCNP